jgi:hypothetical protein
VNNNDLGCQVGSAIHWGGAELGGIIWDCAFMLLLFSSRDTAAAASFSVV